MQQTTHGTILLIHAQPRASRTQFAGRYGDAVKVCIAAPPADGAANEALRRFLAERFGLPIGMVHLVAGEGSRRKRVLLEGASAERVRSLVEKGAR